jgi:response regulator RpfG family c-di-GMP phosphodiesterase
MRLLLVDDDASLRELLRTTFKAVDVAVDEAEDAAAAAAAIAAHRPDVIVLDVHMPGIDGVELCRRLKSDPETSGIGIVLLTGSEGSTEAEAITAGADAYLLKPFSPLQLLAVVERLAGGLHPVPFRSMKKQGPEEQLLLYARDLRHLLEIERGQRVLLQRAYMETVAALATALESKDTGTRAHSQRVQKYAVELARLIEPELAEDASTEYGFLLHDVGKIGIPDQILQKRGPLSFEERVLMETHTLLGEQMLGKVAFLQGEGLRVVRSHHERWDGNGYPDRIAGTDIPLGARVFAVADTLDAMTSNRPYRSALGWGTAREEIFDQAGKQFDPTVVEAFAHCQEELRDIHAVFAAA